MSIAEALLPEFDREMSVTRRLLERVPDGQFGWRPHERSMLLGRLVEHLADMPHWIVETINRGSTEMPNGAAPGMRLLKRALRSSRSSIGTSRTAGRRSSAAPTASSWRRGRSRRRARSSSRCPRRPRSARS